MRPGGNHRQSGLTSPGANESPIHTAAPDRRIKAVGGCALHEPIDGAGQNQQKTRRIMFVFHIDLMQDDMV